MMKSIVVSVTLKAGWGDGSESVVCGVTDEEDLEKLREIEKKFPELLTLSEDVKDMSADVLDYTKWWILGGDDARHEKLYDESIAKFCKEARKNAPPGYCWEEITASIHCGLTNEDLTLTIEGSHADSAESIVEKLIAKGLEFGNPGEQLPNGKRYTIVTDEHQPGHRTIVVDDGDHTTIKLLDEEIENADVGNSD